MKGDAFLGWLRRSLRASRMTRGVRKARLWLEASTTAHVDWTAIRAASPRKLQPETQDPPRVLIATDVGLHFGASRLDSLLAAALMLRGAKVDVMLCDKILPACMAADRSWYPNLRRFIQKGPQADLCGKCFAPARNAWATLGIEPLRMSDLLPDHSELKARRYAAGLRDASPEILRAEPVSEHALAGVLRFFARSTIESSQEARDVLVSYLEASWMAHMAAGEILRQNAYDVVVLHHGIYVPQGPVLAAARTAGARVVTWNPAYRKQTFIFSHQDSYHRTMLSEPATDWADMALTPAWEAATRAYLASRRMGANDWIVFNAGRGPLAADWMRAKGVNPAKPTALAATNVAWDAQIHFEANAFPDMNSWLRDTVEWFAERPELQLIIRIHPAEITGNLPSREPAAAMLNAAFSTWPKNVFIAEPDDPVSTYDLAEHCRAVIIYGSKLGIELATTGKPLIVAGEAWIRGKGFSADARNADHYRDLLAGFPTMQPLDEARQARALRYAFHYFFRRMIPVDSTVTARGWPPYTVELSSLDDIAPGKDAGLDVICDGILSGSPFIFRSERHAPVGVL